MQQITLAALFSKLNFFKDIENQSDLYKVVALDDSLNEMRRDNRLPWSIRRSTLKLFKDIKYYGVESGHDSLLTINNEEIAGYEEAATYLNTDLNQFIEMVKSQRNLLTQLYIDGEQVIGVNNVDGEFHQSIIDTISDVTKYSAVLGATIIGARNVDTLGGYNSLSVNSTGAICEVKNTYLETFSDTDYLEHYYIRRVYLKSIPTSIELRLETDDSNYLAKSFTSQVNGLPFMTNAWNYIGGALETFTETGMFDETSITANRIIINGYTGIFYLSYDSIDEALNQQYWYYSRNLIIASGDTTPTKEQLLNYTTNEYDVNDSLVGPSKWVDVIVNKARQQLLMGIENEYLRNHVASTAKKATSAFDRNFPSQEPKLTTIRSNFNNEPETLNYVP